MVHQKKACPCRCRRARHERSSDGRIKNIGHRASTTSFMLSFVLIAFMVILSASLANITENASRPSPSSSSELDIKDMDMARRIIQKIKDYSNVDTDADLQHQNPSLPSPSSWKTLLRILEKSFLGIEEEEENDSHPSHYSSTYQEANARIQALRWITLDYEKSFASSSSTTHDHNHKDQTIISHHEYENGLLDRYALATIYFATNGKKWTYYDDENKSSHPPSPHFSSEDQQQKQQQFLSSTSHLQWSGVNGNNRDGHVTMLDLSHRNLVSPSFLPLELVLLSPTLELLWLSDNMGLSGTIPNYIGDLTSLSSLSMYRTSMEGSIPKSLYNLPKLSSLRLYKSNFSGSISSNIGKLIGLRWLWLHENRFSGVLPQELGSLSKLEGMTLHGNQFGVIIHDGNTTAGLKSNIIPESVCTNLRMMMTAVVGNVGSSNSEGELKHLWTDCEEDALVLLAVDEENAGESTKMKNASIVKACSCCTRCFPRKKSENEKKITSSSVVAHDVI